MIFWKTPYFSYFTTRLVRWFSVGSARTRGRSENVARTQRKFYLLGENNIVLVVNNLVVAVNRVTVERARTAYNIFSWSVRAQATSAVELL